MKKWINKTTVILLFEMLKQFVFSVYKMFQL